MLTFVVDAVPSTASKEPNLGRDTSSIQVLWKSFLQFLCNSADKPTNQPENKWTQPKTQIIRTIMNLRGSTLSKKCLNHILQLSNCFWKCSQNVWPFALWTLNITRYYYVTVVGSCITSWTQQVLTFFADAHLYIATSDLEEMLFQWKLYNIYLIKYSLSTLNCTFGK